MYISKMKTMTLFKEVRSVFLWEMSDVRRYAFSRKHPRPQPKGLKGCTLKKSDTLM